MHAFAAISQKSREEIRAIQNKKLYKFINEQLYPFSPYYRHLFDRHKINPRKIRALEDLRYIPFTSKKDLIPSDAGSERIKDFILQPDREKIRRAWPFSRLLRMAAVSALKGNQFLAEQMARQYRPIFITFTTGTTARPVPFLYSAYDIENLYNSGQRMIELFQIKADDHLVNLFPYAPHLAFWQVVFGGLSAGVLVLSTGGGKVLSSEGNVNAILRMKPSVILGVPSYVYHIFRLAQEKGHDLKFVKRVILGASKVSLAFKTRLANLLSSMGAKDVSIFGTYGFTEARSAWAECPAPPGVSSGYHLYPDKEIFEVVDPQTGDVKKEGEDGELVYTAIDGRGSVVIRFRTGDFVRGGITYEPCPYCRRTVPRISSDITRFSDVRDFKLSKIKGTLVDLNNFTQALNEIEAITEWQIELRKKDNDPYEIDEVIIYAALKNGVDQSVLGEEIKRKVALCTEVSPNNVIFLSLEEIVRRLELETASKEKRILDLRSTAEGK